MMLLFTTALVIMIGAAVAGAAPSAAKPVPPVYDIYEITVAPSAGISVEYTEGVGVSKGGIAVGRLRGIEIQGGVEKYWAFSWTPGGGTVVLPNYQLRPKFSYGFGVNDSGTVVGEGAVGDLELFPLPLIWPNGGSPSVLPFDMTYSHLGRARSINSSDVAVGSIGDSISQAATIFTGPKAGIIKTLTPGGSWFVEAFSISDKGVVVGQGRDPNDASRTVPFVYDMATDSAFELQSLPGRNGGVAFGVSNRGHIAGTSQMGQLEPLPVVWDPDGRITAIPLPPDTITGIARGVNSDGWVVGYAGGQYSVAFLSDGSATYRLQDLIPKYSGWDLSQNNASSAMGISEEGVIVGTGVYKGEYRAYAMIPRSVNVALDVKPGGCANPINLKAHGVVPVAVLGSADFDVHNIDLATVRLNGVAPLRSSYGDVAAPSEAYTGNSNCSAVCSETRPDGWTDLELKFSTQDLAAVLSDAANRACVKMTLTANLKDGSGSIRGEDVVVVIK